MSVSEDPIEVLIVRHCERTGQTLATAESCTGGLVAHLITNTAGASICFLGGLVAYHNDVKTQLLGVSSDSLAAHGAVSEESVREMAEHARKLFQSDFAVATSGIAGPAGGTPSKPVGLVYVAVAGPKGSQVTKNQFKGERDEVKRQGAEKALEMLAEALGL